MTPWHVTQLEAIGSPVMGDGRINPQEMLLFLTIAQTQWPNRADDLRPKMRDVWHAIRMKRRNVFMKNVMILKEWMAAQLSTPRLWKDDQSTNVSGSLSSPPMLSIVTTMMSKFNMTRSEAWNMRLSEARWYDTCRAEMEGIDVKIAYDNEEEIIDELEGKTESEIIAIIKDQLGEGDFKKWLASRRKNKK